jgi:bifunctional UDP-N-acetylglucosamine pyrophosphorylase/glucosamine-1-phosphate N-acetyltransferase
MTTASGAIVLAAGHGTRMRSARAKVLHELGGEPMIARVIRSLVPLAPAPLVVVVGHQGEAVAAAARAGVPGVRVEAAPQPAQRGTGDAARCGLEAFPPGFDGDVLILYGDMPMVRPATLQAFITEHRRAGADVSFISVTLDGAGAYGRVVRDHAGAVTAIVEARDATPAELAIPEVNTGVYLARAAVLRAALAELRPNNAQGEYYLTDLVSIARRSGLAVQAWCAPDAAEFAGINSLKELAEMEAEIRTAVNRKLMEAGVTIVDPATAYIGEQVEIGRDSTVGPNVQILGRSKVGAGVRIEGTAYLRDVEIGDGCHLKLGVRAEECRIGPHCEIGPFANLRAGTELEGHNRIGNFV